MEIENYCVVETQVKLVKVQDPLSKDIFILRNDDKHTDQYCLDIYSSAGQVNSRVFFDSIEALKTMRKAIDLMIGEQCPNQ